MKRGNNSILTVNIGCDLDTIQKIEFVFVQGDQRMLYDYPSQKAFRDGDNINIVWTQQETMKFKQGSVKMDTHVHIIGADTNPETEIVSFQMNPTLFNDGEIPDD